MAAGHVDSTKPTQSPDRRPRREIQIHEGRTNETARRRPAWVRPSCDRCAAWTERARLWRRRRPWSMTASRRTAAMRLVFLRVYALWRRALVPSRRANSIRQLAETNEVPGRRKSVSWSTRC